MNYVDLQTHTTASDGSMTPTEVVERAIEIGLTAIAITDHDSISGIDEALKATKNRIELIPGIEFTCDSEEFIDIHVLGLFIDHTNKEMVSIVKEASRQRLEQKKEIIKKLNSLGYKITIEDAFEFAKGEIGRPHVAYALLKKYPKEFKDKNDIFEKLLGNNKSAYVPKAKGISIKEAIGVIHKSKGLAILSHPGRYKHEFALKLIDYFLEKGGDGIETYYPYNNNPDYTSVEESKRKVEFFRQIAKEKNILESGGSDFHGETKKVKLGEANVPIEVYLKLKEHILS